MNGHIRPRGPGRWQIVIELARDPETGRRRQIYRSFAGSKRAANERLRELLLSAQGGDTARPERMLVCDWARRWLEHDVRPRCAPATYYHYELAWKWMLPELGKIPLVGLTGQHIQAALNSISDRLSSRSVSHALRVVRGSLREAVRYGHISRNPGDDVRPVAVRSKRRGSLSTEQIAEVLAVVEGAWLDLPVTIAVATGMRRGEILGLQWQDIDLETGIIHVRRAVRRGHDGDELAAPKTQAGTREIPIGPEMVVYLQAHRDSQRARAAEAGILHTETRRVCVLDDFRPVSPAWLTRSWGKLSAALDLRTPLHGLRHSHVSMLLAQRVPVALISQRIGHSSTAVTLQVYSHAIQETVDQAASAVDAQFAINRRGRRANGGQKRPPAPSEQGAAGGE